MLTNLDSAGLARIPTNVAEIFQEVQISATNHKRNCVKLFKIHDDAQGIRTETKTGKERLSGGHAFQEAFLKCLCTALLQDDKKTDARVKLVAQFTGAYFEFVNKRALEKYAAQVEVGDIDETNTDSVERGETSITGFAFTAYMLREFVLKGIHAAKEPVRERVLHFFSKMVRSLGTLAPHHYERLKDGLIKDLKLHDSDKKHRSRAPIVACLACLSTVTKGSDSSIQGILLAVLSPSEPKEVLKAALSGIYVTPDTVPSLVKLSRHADASTRKLAYATFARQILEEDEEEGGIKQGPTHPQNLSAGFIEKLVVSGIQDGETSVKTAAVALVEAWVEVLDEGDHGPSRPIEEGVLSLLKLFKVHKPNSQHRLKAVEVLLGAIFERRREISHAYNFEEEDYWKLVGVEKIVFSRVLVDYLRKTDNERLKDILPLTNNMAGHIGLLLQEVLGIYDAYSVEDASMDEDECDRKETTFIELLKLSAMLDYNDSASGRDQMAQKVEHILREHRLPLEVLPPCIDILLRTKPNPDKKEFVNTIARAASDLRRWASHTPEDQDHLERVGGRCLKMFKLMLQEVNKICDFEQDQALDYISNVFIRPNTVRMRSESVMKDALECEGLLAMVKGDSAPRVFYQNWTRLEQVGAEMAIGIKAVLYKTVFDLLLVYGPRLFKIDLNVPLQWGSVIEDLSARLQPANDNDPKFISVLCHGWMKMILEDHVGDRPELEDSIMLKIFKVWVDLTNRELADLRHAIGEFFKGCGCVAARTQKIVQRLFVPAYREAVTLRARLGRDEVVRTSADICQSFHEWTHPKKLEEALNETKGRSSEVNHSIQLDLACEIVMALFEKNQDGPILKLGDKRELYKLLQRLHTPDTPNEIRLGDLKLLLDGLNKYRPPTDISSKTALQKFEGALTDQYRIQLSSLSEEDHRKLEESRELFDFLADIFSDDESPDLHAFSGPETRSRKRRSLAIAASPQDEAAYPAAKKPRTSTSSAGTGLEENEEDLDAEMSRLLSHGVHLSTTTSSSGVGNVTRDSLFSDSEGEEAEVSGILAE